MGKDYKSTLKGLGERLKTETPKTPIQEVRPVEGETKKKTPKATASTTEAKEAHVNFWAPEELVERMMLFKVKSKKSIKQICAEALEEYLNKYQK